ncbi:hypothetical protein MN116_008300 [Schistosoma mekongi]|uniref:RRM domain-containing protein n=1 Tax=Schistosoma mekongi TaxID=38744 RepID=A0AAE1Z777_SCHME|nr:hypothetical protein MN116_008300 [Schistosoma mekongi]
MDIRPNHTLYVNNLNDKVKKNDLKKALYYIFGQHGRLIDIIAMKTMKMRGQAFIIYQDIACATQAYRSLQGFQLFQRFGKAANKMLCNKLIHHEELTDSM